MASPHSALISALTTFYTLLVDLCYLPASTLVLPSSQTQRHPYNSINRRAAKRYGFSDAAVELAYQIPYVIDDAFRINYETQPLCYLKQTVNASEQSERLGEDDYPEEEEEVEDAWEFAHDPTYQDSDDMWAGRDVLILTRGALYGMELIYDLEKHTITEWQHFAMPPWQDVPSYSMTSAQNPLYMWIRAFLSLQNIPLDDHILIPYEHKALGYPGDNTDDEEAIQQWRRNVQSYEKERELKGVYIQCGWKTDTAESLEESHALMWEILEQARQKAVADFCPNAFNEGKEKWKDSLRLS